MFGAPQAADHRNSEQIVTGQSWISDDPPELISKFIVAGFEIFLILNRLPLADVLLCDEPTLKVEAIELALGLCPMQDLNQAFGEIDCVVDAAGPAPAMTTLLDRQDLSPR